jgi:hypothetical protein
VKEWGNKYGFLDENYIYFPVKFEVDRWLILFYQGSMLKFPDRYLGTIFLSAEFQTIRFLPQFSTSLIQFRWSPARLQTQGGIIID